jgi:hypothetical protein
MMHDTIYRLVKFSSNKTTRQQTELFKTIIRNEGFLANFTILNLVNIFLKKKQTTKQEN